MEQIEMETCNLPAKPLKLQDLIDEYEVKIANAEELASSYEKFVEHIKLESTLGGVYVGNVFNYRTSLSANDIKSNLKKGAWRHVYNLLEIDTIAPASERQGFKREFENPPDFTYENIRATFSDYLVNSRYHILRGLVEVFTKLDPFYKSHSRVKIGVEGLPKRIIFHCAGYGSYGREKLRDVMDSLSLVRGRNKVSNEIVTGAANGEVEYWEGLSFKTFANGNIHISFDKPTLKEINLALNEFYGAGLFDEAVDDEKPNSKKTSHVPSKDLAYYPTPTKVSEKIFNEFNIKGRVLEPSCGCGRLLDALPKECQSYGIEIDATRANIARSKGHAVQIGNFLEQEPTGDFDFIIMNPPFAGLHWLKHIKHALQFLKDGGQLISILPASAWYDHKDEIPDNLNIWRDLPIGSFTESGTNVCTGYLHCIKRKW